MGECSRTRTCDPLIKRQFPGHSETLAFPPFLPAKPAACLAICWTIMEIYGRLLETSVTFFVRIPCGYEASRPHHEQAYGRFRAVGSGTDGTQEQDPLRWRSEGLRVAGDQGRRSGLRPELPSRWRRAPPHDRQLSGLEGVDGPKGSNAAQAARRPGRRPDGRAPRRPRRADDERSL